MQYTVYGLVSKNSWQRVIVTLLRRAEAGSSAGSDGNGEVGISYLRWKDPDFVVEKRMASWVGNPSTNRISPLHIRGTPQTHGGRKASFFWWRRRFPLSDVGYCLYTAILKVLSYMGNNGLLLVYILGFRRKSERATGKPIRSLRPQFCKTLNSMTLGRMEIRRPKIRRPFRTLILQLAAHSLSSWQLYGHLFVRTPLLPCNSVCVCRITISGLQPNLVCVCESLPG